MLLKLVFEQEQAGLLKLSLFFHLGDLAHEVLRVVLLVRTRFRSGLAGRLASLGFTQCLMTLETRAENRLIRSTR